MTQTQPSQRNWHQRTEIRKGHESNEHNPTKPKIGKRMNRFKAMISKTKSFLIRAAFKIGALLLLRRARVELVGRGIKWFVKRNKNKSIGTSVETAYGDLSMQGSDACIQLTWWFNRHPHHGHSAQAAGSRCCRCGRAMDNEQTSGSCAQPNTRATAVYSQALESSYEYSASPERSIQRSRLLFPADMTNKASCNSSEMPDDSRDAARSEERPDTRPNPRNDTQNKSRDASHSEEFVVSLGESLGVFLNELTDDSSSESAADSVTRSSTDSSDAAKSRTFPEPDSSPSDSAIRELIGEHVGYTVGDTILSALEKAVGSVSRRGLNRGSANAKHLKEPSLRKKVSTPPTYRSSRNGGNSGQTNRPAR